MKSAIKKLQEDYAAHRVTPLQVFQDTLLKARENQEKCNSFVTLFDHVEESSQRGDLQNVVYALKDNFSTKGILTTASSNTLSNYVPVYDATVYQKLKDAGAVLIGKTTMDEFGLGGTGLTAHTGYVFNPLDTTRQAGGSSAGSACVVSSGVVPFAIGSDTGDSVRKPAAYCGIVGYKPTYGLISRYGLFAFASSMDHVGVLTRSVYDAAMVVDVIKGKDEKDMTSIDSSSMHLVESLVHANHQPKKLFYIKEIMDITKYSKPSDELKMTFSLFEQLTKKAKEKGISIVGESFDEDLLRAIASTYTCLTCAEATSNLSNLTSILFGPQEEANDVNEMMMAHRTKGFSSLIKRRLIIGSYVLQKENQEKYFINAQRVRRLIVEKMNALFSKYDGLILPCSEGGAKYIDESKNHTSDDLRILENHMAIGNFGGFPSITIPCGFVKGLPVGINITGKVLDDCNVLEIAARLEEMIAYQNPLVKEEM